MRHERHADPLQHMNVDHADELLIIARALAGHPNATAARAERVDRAGLDLLVEIPAGQVPARAEFGEPSPRGASQTAFGSRSCDSCAVLGLS